MVFQLFGFFFLLSRRRTDLDYGLAGAKLPVFEGLLVVAPPAAVARLASHLGVRLPAVSAAGSQGVTVNNEGENAPVEEGSLLCIGLEAGAPPAEGRFEGLRPRLLRAPERVAAGAGACDMQQFD
jgi:hypothetical protein